MNKISKYLLLSIKPKFVERIISGEKQIELRKHAPKVSNGDYLIVYATSPQKEIVGLAMIEGLIEGEPELLWNEYSEFFGIDKADFDKYYNNRAIAFGIKLEKFKKIQNPIKLEFIKNKIPNFQPPQAFRYFSKQEKNFIKLQMIS